MRGSGPANAPDSLAIRENMLQSLLNASDNLTTEFGSWKTGWGDVNRFQRITDDIVHPFSDAAPSVSSNSTRPRGTRLRRLPRAHRRESRNAASRAAKISSRSWSLATALVRWP
ncbi:MAG: hypothetical protein ABJB74_07650 [Gemmatimonas sp.]